MLENPYKKPLFLDTMEEAQIPYETVSNDNPEKRIVVIQDVDGREIIGSASWNQENLNAKVLEDRGDKLHVLLPAGFNADTAWIDSSVLDYLQGNQ